MAYIKKLVMHGFKSFVKKTELPFTHGINVILGPNGSGKSNISDALCFVLGRLSVKSMRAAKAKNLIFLGTKNTAPAKEATVEIVFDNSDNTFSFDEKEVSIKRIVRKNGQSIYKINNQTKTRQEILGLLAQAGVDPNGFNIILQGEIQNFVKMHTEERRKIIEEVSGISIYEMQKDKSLKELSKTEDKLKEIASILRERTAYLNNLEKERQQALKFKKLEKDIQVYKASIIHDDLTKKKKETDNINSEIAKKNKEIEKVKKVIVNFETSVQNFEAKIASINSKIQSSIGLEQEKLNQEITNIKADLAGFKVKTENYEKKIFEIDSQKQELTESVSESEIAIRELQKESPTISKKEKDIAEKKSELEKLEEQRKKFYTLKSELKSVKERIQDKKSLLQNNENESEFLLKQIKIISSELFDKTSTTEKLEKLKFSLNEKKGLLFQLVEKEKKMEKFSYTSEVEIEGKNRLIEKIAKMDICPVCKSKITKEHICEITKETQPQIDKLSKLITETDKELAELEEKKNLLQHQIDEFSLEISRRESDLLKLSNIDDKKQQIKVVYEKTESLKKEISELESRRKTIEKDFDKNSNVEQKYELARVEMQEISLRTKENVNSEIAFKQRELERSKIAFKKLKDDEENIKEEFKDFRKVVEVKEILLEKKNKQEEELTKKCEKLINERDGFQMKIRQTESELSENKNKVYNIEQDINNFKIEKARIDAEVENFEIEMLKYPNVEIMKTARQTLVERLAKAQEIIAHIGSVNMRSLEVYDSVKREYDAITEKTQVIEKEKQGILKIIHEIDIKKKKTFLQTLNSLNEIFSRNFTQLSTKGQVTLELENRKDPFSGGVNIIVKTGHGKYFDVTSLSGGEQTLVALSLIFTIQELKPYCFYILDEIDAALDKRNSNRLAGLLQKYMQKGQYIVITHNDEVITNATNLYGVSMHEGISKVISLKL